MVSLFRIHPGFCANAMYEGPGQTRPQHKTKPDSVLTAALLSLDTASSYSSFFTFLEEVLGRKQRAAVHLVAGRLHS